MITREGDTTTPFSGEQEHRKACSQGKYIKSFVCTKDRKPSKNLLTEDSLDKQNKVYPYDGILCRFKINTDQIFRLHC